MKSLFGGSDSSKTESSQSGFGLLPTEMQNAWKQYGSQIGDLFKTSQASAFTLPALSSGSQTAMNNLMNMSYAPTAESIKSDIAMQQNPYDQYVIDTINREAKGSGSQLQQTLNSAGQFGSNRATLGANDIDLSRLNQIGTFKQGEYNTALNNALTTLPNQRTAAAGTSLQTGITQQNQTMQNNQAAINALKAYGQLVGILPTSGGSTSSGSSTTSSDNGILNNKLVQAGIGALFG